MLLINLLWMNVFIFLSWVFSSITCLIWSKQMLSNISPCLSWPVKQFKAQRHKFKPKWNSNIIPVTNVSNCFKIYINGLKEKVLLFLVSRVSRSWTPLPSWTLRITHHYTHTHTTVRRESQWVLETYLDFWGVSAKWLNFTRILFALKYKEKISQVQQPPNETPMLWKQPHTYFSRHDEGRWESPLHMKVSGLGKTNFEWKI